MNSDFKKNQMLTLLHSLDKRLDEPIILHICGGAACIVGHNFTRRSMDIDVLESSPVLESIHNQIKEVAKELYLEDEKWINNDSIRGDHYIPDDYLDGKCNGQTSFEEKPGFGQWNLNLSRN